MAVRKEHLIAWLNDLQRVYVSNSRQLTDLDAAIGDADHGSNMERGFSAVKTGLATNVPADIGGLLHTVAAVLIRTVGGASGPLYGTFFLRAGAACSGKTELAADDVVAMFQAGIDGVRQRGKAEPGDKTMLDALLPALAAMQEALSRGLDIPGIMSAGAAAAQAGMLATVPMQARKGRASYLGARSIGHQDPGATSSFLLLDTAAGLWRNS